MNQLCKNKTGRQAIAARLENIVGFPVKRHAGGDVLYFLKLKLALNPAGAYIPHSFYNE